MDIYSKEGHNTTQQKTQNQSIVSTCLSSLLVWNLPLPNTNKHMYISLTPGL